MNKKGKMVRKKHHKKIKRMKEKLRAQQLQAHPALEQEPKQRARPGLTATET